MGSTQFGNPRALSRALAVLGTLQPRALGFLNHVDPLVSVCTVHVADISTLHGPSARVAFRSGTVSHC